MTDLASKLPDLLDLDVGTSPPTVRLRTPSVLTGADAQSAVITADSPSVRVRHDLFVAVLDYLRDGGYVWDSDRNLAVLAEGGIGIPIPTISGEEFQARKREFADEMAFHS